MSATAEGTILLLSLAYLTTGMIVIPSQNLLARGAGCTVGCWWLSYIVGSAHPIYYCNVRLSALPDFPPLILLIKTPESTCHNTHIIEFLILFKLRRAQ